MSGRDNYSGRKKSAFISDLLKKPNEIAAALSDSSVTFEKVKLYGAAALYAEPYVDNLIAVFDGRTVNLESLGDLFSFKDLFEFVDFNKPSDASGNTDLMRNERFRDKLISNYKALCVVLVGNDKPSFSKERVGLIEEGFSLYDHAFHAGAVCLLLSVFEGILTEYLAFKKFIFSKADGKFYFVGDDKKDKYVSGLYVKLEIANKNSEADFLSNIFAWNVFLNSDKEKISNFRNSVLHGNSLNFGFPEYSKMTLLLVYFLVLYIRKDDGVKVSHPPEADHASP